VKLCFKKKVLLVVSYQGAYAFGVFVAAISGEQTDIEKIRSSKTKQRENPL
jgi:hypothetical protein